MKYGAKKAMWAPFAEGESEGSATTLPKYEAATSLDGVNETNDSLNFAEASAYGDNAKKISIKEFSGGTITAKFVWIPVKTVSAILGTAVDDEEGQAYGGEDEAPYGGYGFISHRMDSKKNKFYEVVFYPKVQGSADSSNYKTKEDSITLEYDSIPFNILLPECGKYKVEKRFKTEAAAITYLESLFKGEAKVPGLTVPAEDIETNG